jgi:hypothetical protein
MDVDKPFLNDEFSTNLGQRLERDILKADWRFKIGRVWVDSVFPGR